MQFEKLLHLVADQPLFETGLLLSGDVDPNDVRRQLSRWVSAGKLKQLRRGLYTLAPPYQKITPHPFLIANFLMPGSYVSLQSALAYYGLIPVCPAALFGDLDFALERQSERYDFRAFLKTIRSDLDAQGYAVELKVNDQKAVHSPLYVFPGCLLI